MAATAEDRSRLSDEDLEELLALIEDADSVELKATVPESEQRSAVSALAMDPLESQIARSSSSTRRIWP